MSIGAERCSWQRPVPPFLFQTYAKGMGPTNQKRVRAMKYTPTPIILWSAALMLAPVGAAAQNQSNISTAGSNNAVLTDQSAAVGASINVEQIGSNNRFEATQESSNADLAVSVDGNAQTQIVVQRGLTDNHATIQAIGSNNEATLFQDGSIGSNIATLVQTGSGNQAIMNQYALGGVNSIMLGQFGNNNLAELTQNGVDNDIQLQQNGDNNAAAVTQNGNGLGFALTQNGGAQVTVTQTSPGG